MRNGFLILLLGCGFSLCAAAPETEKLLWESWRGAHAALEQGEALLEKNDSAAALKAFRKAKAEYERIQKLDPDWNTRIIRNRLTLTDDAIARLGSPAAKLSDADTSPAALRSRLDAAQAELAALRRSANGNKVKSDDIESLMREKRALEDQLSVLEKRCAEQKKKLDDPASEQAKLRTALLGAETVNSDQEKKLALLRQQYATKEAEWKSALRQLESMRKDLSVAVSERDLAVRNLEAMMKIGTAKGAERDDYAAELKDRDKQLTQARQELESLRSDNQKLESRIAMMRKGGGLDKLNIEIMDENRDMKAKLLAANNKVDELTSAMRQSDGGTIELRKDNLNLKEAVARLTARGKLQENDLKTTKTALDRETAAGKLVRVELDNLRGVNKELKDGFSALAEKNKTLETRLATRDKADIQTLAELNAAQKKLTALNADLLSRVAALNTKLDASRKLSEAADATGDRLTKENARLKKLIAEFSRADGAGSELRRELTDLTQRCEKLEDALKAVRLENAALKQGKNAVPNAPDALAETIADAARTAEKDGDWDGAVWYYTELLKLTPDNKDCTAKLEAAREQSRRKQLRQQQ